jgi:hypothetical protein
MPKITDILFWEEMGYHFVAQVDPERMIFLPQSPKYREYRCEPPHPAES